MARSIHNTKSMIKIKPYEDRFLIDLLDSSKITIKQTNHALLQDQAFLKRSWGEIHEVETDDVGLICIKFKSQCKVL